MLWHYYGTKQGLLGCAVNDLKLFPELQIAGYIYSGFVVFVVLM